MLSPKQEKLQKKRFNYQYFNKNQTEASDASKNENRISLQFRNNPFIIRG